MYNLKKCTLYLSIDSKIILFSLFSLSNSQRLWHTWSCDDGVVSEKNDYVVLKPVLLGSRSLSGTPEDGVLNFKAHISIKHQNLLGISKVRENVINSSRAF